MGLKLSPLLPLNIKLKKAPEIPISPLTRQTDRERKRDIERLLIVAILRTSQVREWPCNNSTTSPLLRYTSLDLEDGDMDPYRPPRFPRKERLGRAIARQFAYAHLTNGVVMRANFSARAHSSAVG